MTTLIDLHLDAAGCALPAPGVVEAMTDHLRREVEVGGYAAAVDAADAIDGLHHDLGGLVGLAGDEVALVANGTAALAALVLAWHLPTGAKVGVARSAYGSNRMALLAAGATVVDLPTDRVGRVDPAAVDGSFALVHLDHVASQRGVAQPAAAVAAACHAVGVPFVLDVAQTAGHLDCSAIGADAYVGTARKWLRGPRGLGWLAIRREVAERLLPPAPNLHSAAWTNGHAGTVPVASAARMAVGEAPVAAWLGLAAALPATGPATWGRLAALGPALRRVVDGVGGWRVREPLDEPTAIVTLEHDRLDPVTVKAALEAGGMLVAAVPTVRAADLARPLLRLSPHTWVADGDLSRIPAALERASSAATR